MEDLRNIRWKGRIVRTIAKKVESSHYLLDIYSLTDLGPSGRPMACDTNSDELSKLAATFYLKFLLEEVSDTISVARFG